jgi:hypothetical protein
VCCTSRVYVCVQLPAYVRSSAIALAYMRDQECERARVTQ